MIAYKFLSPGRVGRFSQFNWPGPGTWVRVSGPLDACQTGIHACAVEDLPWWVDQELWTIELEGEVVRSRNSLIADGGALRERVTAWTSGCAREYAEACARRAASHAVTALERAGHTGDADRLAAAASMEDLFTAAAELAPLHADTRSAVTMARDGARRALTQAAPAAAYIAAHLAARVGGPDAFALERIWQSDWLVARLEL